MRDRLVRRAPLDVPSRGNSDAPRADRRAQSLRAALTDPDEERLFECESEPSLAARFFGLSPASGCSALSLGAEGIALPAANG
jgi:hypothetical protein